TASETLSTHTPGEPHETDPRSRRPQSSFLS
ncbi:MAG: hypothetical protein QG577_1083, partial [Thermodesulfobacteriota bacterium]|nr:hypothetical protein [Thermodesulfobacteriota bacterium]